MALSTEASSGAWLDGEESRQGGLRWIHKVKDRLLGSLSQSAIHALLGTQWNMRAYDMQVHRASGVERPESNLLVGDWWTGCVCVYVCVYGSVGSTFMRVKSRQSDGDTEWTEKQIGVRKETQCHFNSMWQHAAYGLKPRVVYFLV